jgi:nucleoid-associated protein YgaU
MDVQSRYAESVPMAALDTRAGTGVTYAVFRNPARSTQPGAFRRHIWLTGDRWDFLAAKYLGNPKLWYQLLDYNPNIQDPFFIEPGTVVVVPTRNTTG